MIVALYLAVIALANVATANLDPWITTFLGEPVVITAGTWFIGAAFFLRDAVQIRHGLRVVYAAIAGALLVNLGMSLHYDDLAWIAAGSALALLVSELADTAAFTRWRGNLGARIAVSGAVSCPLDSIIFVLVALSPWTTGIVPWAAVPATIALQALLKFALQVVVAVPAWRVEVGVPRGEVA